MSGRRRGPELALALWVGLVLAALGISPSVNHGREMNPRAFLLTIVVCGVAAFIVGALITAVPDGASGSAAKPKRSSTRRARRRRRHEHRPPRMCRWVHRRLGWWRRIEIDGHRDIYCRCGRAYRRRWEWRNPPTGAAGVPQ